VADIFMSFVEQDRDRALQVAEALTNSSWIVLVRADAAPWSQESLRRGTSAQIRLARCVVVLFSRNSLSAPSILEEYTMSQVLGIPIVRVLIDDEKPSSVFGTEPFLDLTSWHGADNAPEFEHLKQVIGRELTTNRSDALTRKTATTGASVKRGMIFICYRRDDTEDAAGRLYDQLATALGSDRVFIDIDDIPLGVDFVEHVSTQISRCDAVVVMIGRQWLKLRDKHRRRRLDDADDTIRLEIAAALSHNLPLIPIVVQGAEMPTADDLPENIRPLARRNGLSLSATHWHTDVARLIKELDRVMGRHP
jgi:hypothetical protein